MKSILCVLILFGLSIAAHAEDWSGRLIDATCNDQKDQTKTISCDATARTTAFALDVDGKIYKLDPPGNLKAADALKYRAIPANDPAKPPSMEIKATVTGTEASGMIMMDSIGLK